MKLIIDLDGVVFDTIQTIVDMYNLDHLYYKDFELAKASDVTSWDFDELSLESREEIDKYFCTPRFFTNLVLMNSADWIIKRLDNDGYRIIFCSSGTYPNLQLKRQWIRKHYPFAEFIPVELPHYSTKEHIDMSDCMFIDDVSKNLKTSNAEIKVCFGKEYSWNEDWDGTRCKDWAELYHYIKGLEKKEDGKNKE